LLTVPADQDAMPACARLLIERGFYDQRPISIARSDGVVIRRARTLRIAAEGMRICGCGRANTGGRAVSELTLGSRKQRRRQRAIRHARPVATLVWQGPRLYVPGRTKPLISLAADPDNAFAWRVRLPGGKLSEPLDIGRARAQAEALVRERSKWGRS
jgi:hypothetical protein